MSKNFYIFLGVGLVIVGIAIGAILIGTHGNHLELKGSIKKVRSLNAEETSTIGVFDFHVENPSDEPFVIRKVEVLLTGADGKEYDGDVVAEIDAGRIFKYYPILGQKYNDTLRAATRIPGRTSIDRMVAARFEVPGTVFDARRKVRIRLEDVDGPVSEIE